MSLILAISILLNALAVGVLILAFGSTRARRYIGKLAASGVPLNYLQISSLAAVSRNNSTVRQYLASVMENGHELEQLHYEEALRLMTPASAIQGEALIAGAQDALRMSVYPDCVAEPSLEQRLISSFLPVHEAALSATKALQEAKAAKAATLGGHQSSLDGECDGRRAA